MSKQVKNKNVLKAGGLLMATCAACCAPIIATPLVAMFVAGGVTLTLLGQIALALVFLAGGGGYLWYHRKRRTAQSSDKNCSCGPNEGCNAGDACVLPMDKTPSFMDRLKSIC
jgi:hypothetical protein